MKKIFVTLAMALFVISMSTSAWAACSTQVSPYTGNTNTSNSGCIVSGSGYTSADLSQVSDILSQFGCINGTADSAQCSGQANTTTLPGYTSQGNLYAYYCPNQQTTSTENTDCPSSQAVSAAAANPSDDRTGAAADSASAPSSATADSTQDTSTVSDASDTKTAETAVTPTETAETAAPSTCNDSGCSASDTCSQTNCAQTGTLCNTNNCATSTTCGTADTNTAASESDISAAAACDTADTSAAAALAPGNTFYDYLVSLLEKCGINADQISFLKTVCPGAVPSDTSSATPSDSGSANTSTDNGSASTPSDSGTTTTPADNTTTPAPNTDADSLSFEAQVVALVNEERAANGLAPLTLSEDLSNAARAKSQDMHDNNYFSHTSPTYGSPFDMLKSFGISYNAAGENIAMGYATPDAVMEGWMNSSGHRANILNSAYTQIGVGYVANGNYWTQEFIG